MSARSRRLPAGVILSALLTLGSPGLNGQTPPAPEPAPQAAEVPPVRKPERFAFGFRVRNFPLPDMSLMENRQTMTTVVSGKTPFDWNYKTTANSVRVGGGPAVELRLRTNLTLTAELMLERLRYEQVAEVFSGSDNPNTSNDERTRSATTENTQARLWDLPVLVHYRGLGSSGLLSQLHLAAGVAARHVARIRTSGEIANADGSTSSLTTRAQPSARNLLGAVVGAGFRFTDDFNIKVTPEVRFTRWSGATFATDTTRSPRSQFEFGVGFTR